MGGCIAGCAHPFEKTTANIRDTSIHRLPSWLRNLGSSISARKRFNKGQKIYSLLQIHREFIGLCENALKRAHLCAPKRQTRLRGGGAKPKDLLAGRWQGCRTAAAGQQCSARTEEERADATLHQTQPYQASASPIFWSVQWQGVRDVGVTNTRSCVVESVLGGNI
jgi:hypothetical protein